MGKLLDITKELLLTRNDLEELGRLLSKAPKRRIESNKVTGPSLASSTIRSKRRRGSGSPETKLRDTSELADDITFEVRRNVIRVGNTNKKHKLTKRATSRRWKKRRAKNQRTKISDIGRIHNDGLGAPKRSYLYPSQNQIFREEENIIKKFLDNKFKRLLK